jgi:hypothetical protein
VKEYKLIGPVQNVSADLVKCPACPGDGTRTQPGSIPDKCSVCAGIGKIAGLMKLLNDAAAEGWVVVTHTTDGGSSARQHFVTMERDKA